MLKKLNKILCIILSLSLIFENVCFAQGQGVIQVNVAGYLSQLNSQAALGKFRPLHLRYLSYSPNDNTFQMLLDKGDVKGLNTTLVEDTSKTLLKYFFIGLRLPNDSFWVNLRPDAEDRIIDDSLAETDIGKVMLDADLNLKIDTARFTSPETPEGRAYWNKLYEKAGQIYGTQNVTIPTLTRPWIVPGEIIIRQSSSSAYIYKATLKVCLEQDYLKGSATYSFKDDQQKQLNEYSSDLIRELIIPKLTEEVNTSSRYAPLRQVYYSLIMAQWFKANFKYKDNVYNRFIDSRNLNNLISKDAWSKTTYFKAYQKSFKDGEYNTQERINSAYGQSIRSYFSGGMNLALSNQDFAPGGKVSIVSALTSSPVVDSNNLVGVILKADSTLEVTDVRSDFVQASEEITKAPVIEDHPSKDSGSDSLGKMEQIITDISARIRNGKGAVSSSPVNSPVSFIKRKLERIFVTTMLFMMLIFPNIANAAKFELSPDKNQIVAVVEQGDNDWNIAGVAYKNAPGIGKAKYAPHSQWPRIYESNSQIHNRPNNALRPMYPDGSYYKDDKHIIINIRPGDRLNIPGPVNYKELGLEEQVVPNQQQLQAQDEQQKLQEAESKSQQELTQVRQQTRAAQADLESLQKEKTELSRQILDLKKELADIQNSFPKAGENLTQETQQLLQEKIKFTQEIAGLEKQYQKAVEDLRQINAQKEKAAQESAQLQNQAPLAKDQANLLQEGIKKLESQKAQFQQELSELGAQKEGLQKSIDQLNQDKVKSQQELDNLKQQLTQAEDALKQASQKAQSNWDDVFSGTGRTGLIFSFIAGLGAAFLFLRFVVPLWLKGKIKSSTDKIKKLQRERESLQAEVNALNAQKDDNLKIKQEAEKAKREAAEEAGKLARQQAKLKAEEDRIKKESQDLERQRQELFKQKQSQLDIDSQKQVLIDEIVDLERQRDDLVRSLDDVGNRIGEAIRKAREEQDQIANQVQLPEKPLSDNQRRLKDELEARKLQVNNQITALEEEHLRVKQNLTEAIAEIDRAKAEVQTALGQLTSQRDKAQREIGSMNSALSSLKNQQDKLQQLLQGVERDGQALQKTITQMQDEEKRLQEEAEERLRKEEELKAKAEPLMKDVKNLVDLVDSLLGIIGPPKNNKIFSVVEEQVKGILGNTAFEIKPVSIASGGRNMIVKIPATKGAEQLQKIILNAHMDIVDGHGYDVEGGDRQRRGALDDRAGVVAILGALTDLKERLLSKNIPHGQIVIIFTDLEEQQGGGFGAKDLVSKYNNKKEEDKDCEDLFDNTHILITVDGPIIVDYPRIGFRDSDFDRLDERSRKNPFVIAKSLNISNRDRRYKIIFDSVARVGFNGYLNPREPDTDGPGDHREFARVQDKVQKRNIPVINLRAPYNDTEPLPHQNEKVNIENELAPIASWVSEIVLGLVNDMTKTKDKDKATESISLSAAPRDKSAVKEFRALPRAIISDLDNTLSDTTAPISSEMADKLVQFLMQEPPVQIAINTAQSKEEVEEYLVQPIKDALIWRKASFGYLRNLYIYPCLSSQGYKFDSNGDLMLMPESEYHDYIQGTPFADEEGRLDLIAVIEEVLKTKLVVVGPVIDRKTRPQVPYIHNRIASFTLGKIHGEAAAETLKRKFDSPEWRDKVSVKVGGGGSGTIHIVPGNVNKSFGVNGFRKILDKLPGARIENYEILIVGDDFRKPDHFRAGLDRDMVFEGANVYSMSTPQDELPVGAKYYGKGPQKTLELLKKYPIPDQGRAVSSPLKMPIIETPGGIDFRFLPIVTEAIGNLSINTAKVSRLALSNVNLATELRQIENMLNAGIIPSTERIKEYLQASCLKGSSVQDVDKVLSCISGILRLEEERCCTTETELKDILIVLESSRSGAELSRIFLGKPLGG
jgi:predicted  nucleic acid-binding Zn-ribbon protein